MVIEKVSKTNDVKIRNSFLRLTLALPNIRTRE
jgi:hypothetical protein